MQNLSINLRKQIFPIGLILVLALARLIPHPPNFTPVIAVAIMSGYFFKNINLSFLVLIIAMLVSDLFIGFYENVIFVYAALLLITFTFYKIANKLNFKNLFFYGFIGSLIFFMVSNFGVWALGNPGPYGVPYENNLNGLIECYFLAIPFFSHTLLATILFSYSAFFASYFYKKISIN